MQVGNKVFHQVFKLILFSVVIDIFYISLFLHPDVLAGKFLLSCQSALIGGGAFLIQSEKRMCVYL